MYKNQIGAYSLRKIYDNKKDMEKANHWKEIVSYFNYSSKPFENGFFKK